MSLHLNPNSANPEPCLRRLAHPLGGDEFGRTQQGNNNAYCQDNKISWYDWALLEENQELYRFSKELIQFRQMHRVFLQETYFMGEPAVPGGNTDLLWFDVSGKPQEWNGERELACCIDGSVNAGVTLYMMFNPTHDPVSFRIPKASWTGRINTAASLPNDIVLGKPPRRFRRVRWRLSARSLVVLSTHSKLSHIHGVR